MTAARRNHPHDQPRSSGRRISREVDLDRLADVMMRMERGDAVPLDPSWLEGVPPLTTTHVLVLHYSQSIVEQHSAYMKRVPIRGATTFPGLCKVHDGSLFDPIDKHSLRESTSEQLFLLALRSVLRDLYTAHWMARHRQGLLEVALDQPSAPGVLEMFIASLLRVLIVVPRLTRIAECFARWYRERRFDGVPAIIGKHLPVLPFAVSNYIAPLFDDQGRPVDRSADPPPFIVLNVVPEKGRIDRRRQLSRRASARARIIPRSAPRARWSDRLR